jgi:hypothetical protein
MTLPLPNLDDRRWQDLVEEGQSLIPLFEPEWTDHNVHDPGIMLMELLAWISEMDIYWVNRIPDSHRYKFLALAGYTPRPPRPSRTMLALTLKEHASTIHLPRGVRFAAPNGTENKIIFSTAQSINVIPGSLESIQLRRGEHWTDLTTPLGRGEQPYLLGPDPRPGDALYLGFSQPLPSDVEVTLGFSISGSCTTSDVWERMKAEAGWRAEFCPPHLPFCASNMSNNPALDLESLREHHSVQLVWEYFDAGGHWRRLDPQKDQRRDTTRALSMDGLLHFTLPGSMRSTRLGGASGDLYYLRARFERGAYDAAPRLDCLVLNGVPLVQAARVHSYTWTILPGASITGTPPALGSPASFDFQLDEMNQITGLQFHSEGAPGFVLLGFRPPSDHLTGRLAVAVEPLNPGDGRPDQIRQISSPLVSQGELSLWSWEAGEWVRWEPRRDLLNAKPSDSHFLLDLFSDQIHFGNGEKGRTLPKDARLYATYYTTQAQNGNLQKDVIHELVQDTYNRALLASSQDVAAKLKTIKNPIPAMGGLPVESLEQLQARALADLARPTRAVTLADIEQLAKETPGICLARVTAIPNLHPAYPCYQAPGVITVIVMPFLPTGAPQASPNLIRKVQAYLNARRVVGTRLLVTRPQYHAAAVRVRIRAVRGVNPVSVRAALERALDAFFDPLSGGPDRQGWPFGRSIYRSEVLQVMDETPGVDHVLDLELIDEDGQPSCGNLCLRPLELVDAQPHQIEVIES